ncbi:VanW family protein [uncultured Nocardioides sp.]|uniref:Vancomycin B-type resistance protein VanW n=1 Tax=uncultured Nocardioides sp. TaxID=198441 RepID=A0A6J4NWL6_9ACTN|nr:VanW family protein [uncultured Nocardioides sp.]CAA9397375.1 MAG: Vancomycin B-type resistance protein VanW [uncultured Nocardioides sp.]
MFETTTSTVREKAGARVVVLLLLGLAVLAGGAYALAHEMAGDKVPRGTTVSGVDIGGLPRERAAAVLEEGLTERAAAPMALTIGDNEQSVTPAEAGLGVDLDASVAQAGGGDSWSPARLWDYYTGGDDLDAEVVVDDAAMATLATRLTAAAGSAPREGAVRFRGAQVRTREARPGAGIDTAQLRDELVEVYLSDATAELDLVEVEPEIDGADVQQALTSFANPAVAEPVELAFDTSTVRLAPADYTRALSLAPQGGALVPQLDAARLAEVVSGRVGEAGAPVDATVALVDGRPKVVPAKPGVGFDQAQIDAAFLALVAAPPGERRLPVTATVAQPEFTTKDARALGIEERVSSFTTYYPYAEYRNINIGRAAELVDGTVLRPGETFSLNDTVGERTAENGFTEGFVISNGIFKEDLGGGVSQMATTTFNAMFFAGLKDIEHKPHSFYIDRYPVGREATVAWGAVDLRFQNDTPYGVLISANVTPAGPGGQGVVTVSMWSTKTWDITTTTSGRYNPTSPATRTLSTADCYPNTGYSGFEVDVTRYFRKPGQSELHRAETFHTVYTPSDTVICQP